MELPIQQPQESTQPLQARTNTSCLQITQGGSKFCGTLTATGDSRLSAGSFVNGVSAGTVHQDPSIYEKDIHSGDKAKIDVGNYVNGQSVDGNGQTEKSQ
jgi:hypothetical protein